MTVRRILRIGDPRLLQRAQPVTAYDTPELHALAADLRDTLRAAGGQGLAATQIGVGLRVIALGIDGDWRHSESETVPCTVLVNPELMPVGEGTIEAWEGCLSIPGKHATVARSAEVRYRGFDLSGRPINRHASGAHARLLQHECDHLDGILYPMRLGQDVPLHSIRRRILASRARAAVNLLRMIRHEWTLARATAGDRALPDAYGRNPDFRPGGRLHAQGLFDWERRALSSPPFRAGGRVLVGGAGAGRELVGLHALGYETVAFEPSEPLAQACADWVHLHPPHRFARGSYADLARAASRDDGPLASLVRGTPFDGVILGWGSFAHVDDGERVTILQATRRLAPTAPLLLSYLTRPRGRVESWRPAVRRWVSRLAGAVPAADDAACYPHIGLVYWLDAHRLERLAAQAGYRIARSATEPYPHALLVPAGSPAPH